MHVRRNTTSVCTKTRTVYIVQLQLGTKEVGRSIIYSGRRRTFQTGFFNAYVCARILRCLIMLLDILRYLKFKRNIMTTTTETDNTFFCFCSGWTVCSLTYFNCHLEFPVVFVCLKSIPDSPPFYVTDNYFFASGIDFSLNYSIFKFAS